ncbi:hypothetical protein ACA910_006791 [Epithemia clementina (nom. ined.)]
MSRTQSTIPSALLSDRTKFTTASFTQEDDLDGNNDAATVSSDFSITSDLYGPFYTIDLGEEDAKSNDSHQEDEEEEEEHSMRSDSSSSTTTSKPTVPPPTSKVFWKKQPQPLLTNDTENQSPSSSTGFSRFRVWGRFQRAPQKHSN